MDFDECLSSNLVLKRRVERDTAKALMKLAEVRLNNLVAIQEPTLRVEYYYEVIKELLTALLHLDGYKSYSHECLISYLRENYSPDFHEAEVQIINTLRIMRNDIVYRGTFIDASFLRRNEIKIKTIIKKLQALLTKKVND